MSGDQHNQAGEGWAGAGEEWVDELHVCTTHQRFIPCRVDSDDCRITSDPVLVEIVREWQQGEVAR